MGEILVTASQWRCSCSSWGTPPWSPLRLHPCPSCWRPCPRAASSCQGRSHSSSSSRWIPIPWKDMWNKTVTIWQQKEWQWTKQTNWKISKNMHNLSDKNNKTQHKWQISKLDWQITKIKQQKLQIKNKNDMTDEEQKSLNIPDEWQRSQNITDK